MATDQYIYTYAYIHDTYIYIYIYHYVYIHIHVIIPCSEGYSRSQLTAYAHLLEMHYGWEGALFQKKTSVKTTTSRDNVSYIVIFSIIVFAQFHKPCKY